MLADEEEKRKDKDPLITTTNQSDSNIEVDTVKNGEMDRQGEIENEFYGNRRVHGKAEGDTGVRKSVCTK